MLESELQPLQQEQERRFIKRKKSRIRKKKFRSIPVMRHIVIQNGENK